MRSPARAALVEGWPLLLSSVIVAIPYGIIARQSGLSVAEAAGTSLLIFAGASQFAAVQLLAGGAPAPIVVLTVFFVNLRHLLMAAALRPYLGGASSAQRLAMGYVLTDESFAMAIGWFRRGRRELTYYAVFAVSLWAAWNVATVIGAVAGAGIVEPRRYGVDFAITASFLAIVTLAVRHRNDVVVALTAAVVAGALRLLGASAVAVVAAGAIAPLLVLLLPSGEGEGP